MEKLDVKNIIDSVNIESRDKIGTNYLTEQQIRKYKKYGSEFIEDIKFMYAHECTIISIVIHCRPPTATEFRPKLGFHQCDINWKKNHPY